MNAREEQVADAGFNDGLDEKPKYSSLPKNRMSMSEQRQYDEQYEVGKAAKKEQRQFASKR